VLKQDAGYEILDVRYWMYGYGVSKIPFLGTMPIGITQNLIIAGINKFNIKGSDDD